MSGPNANLIKSSKTEFDTSNELFGKHCVFTGTMETMSRTEAMQALADVGGFPQNAVNAVTDYLVMQNNGILSNKAKKAQQTGVAIVTEDQFIAMLHSGSGKATEVAVFGSLEEVVEKVEILDESQQELLHYAIYETITKKDPQKAVVLDDASALVDHHFLVPATIENALTALKIGDMRKALKTLQKGSAGKTKDEVRAKILALDAEEQEAFLQSAHTYELAPSLKTYAKKLNSYLHRKFDRELVIDLDFNETVCPAGATECVKVTPAGSVKAWTYADSDVTRLLIKHDALPKEFDWSFDFLES